MCKPTRRFHALLAGYCAFLLLIRAAPASAQTVAAQVGSAQTETATSEPGDAKHAASPWARGELSGVQMLGGAAIGAELCALAGCNNARAWAGATLLGAGGGLTLSLLTTRDGITSGRAQAVNLGTIYGAVLGIATLAATGSDDPGGKSVAASALAGQLAGTGLGLLADNALSLTSGEVGLAGSGLLLTAVTSGLALAAVDPQGDANHIRRRFVGTSIVTTSLGLVAGGWLARRDKVSRARALMVDLGALAGGGLLPLAGWFVRGEDAQAEALLWSSVAGALGGAATVYLLTRTWDAPEVPNVSVSFSPTQGGGLAQLSLPLK